jgi:pimeloyl-ACP methyl ester carboxylesterase
MNKPQDKSDVQGKSARTRRGCLGNLGDLPLIVLSAGATFDQMPEAVVTAIGRDVLAQVIQVSQELQQELVSLSTQGKQVIAEKSGHYIQWDQPDLVIDAIREVADQVCGK